MSVTNSYPEPLKNALREALEREMAKQGLDAEETIDITVSSETFGTMKIAARPSGD